VKKGASRKKNSVTKRVEVIVTKVRSVGRSSETYVGDRADGEDVSDPNQGENKPLKLRKSHSRNTFFFFGMQRFKYKGVEFVMFRNETVRTLKGSNVVSPNFFVEL
jgi:hypothetical protein